MSRPVASRVVAGAVVVSAALLLAGPGEAGATEHQVNTDCATTERSSSGPPSDQMRRLSEHWLRSGRLWMGYTRGSRNFESRPTTGQKIAWYREVRGPLRIRGQRIDAPASPLTARVPYGYGQTGFQSSRLFFPTPGCWKVSAVVGTSRAYVFVIRVARDRSSG